MHYGDEPESEKKVDESVEITEEGAAKGND